MTSIELWARTNLGIVASAVSVGSAAALMRAPLEVGILLLPLLAWALVLWFMGLSIAPKPEEIVPRPRSRVGLLTGLLPLLAGMGGAFVWFWFVQGERHMLTLMAWSLHAGVGLTMAVSLLATLAGPKQASPTANG